MVSQLSIHKIRPDHLDRQALIYVRQSTLIQVRENTGSTARQYDLVQRALDLGWPRERIVIVDQDQGLSGASAVGREGFQHLVAEVGLGRAGAVLSIEASRLARSCSDWFHLIEICALTKTLVVDEEGIYDPSQYNDRLLLGFKGTMSEAELHWLRNRLLGGKLEKVRQGDLRLRLPTGLVYDARGEVIFDPDEQVQQSVWLVFDLFDELGSTHAVVKHFTMHQLLFPTRVWGGARHGELDWGPLSRNRVWSMLHNPAYAGAYVYGRKQACIQASPDEAVPIRSRTRHLKREDWFVVLHDVYPAYITWDQFLRNEQQLDDNRTYRPEEHRGAVREGTALLQGIALCGRCGRRMSVRYLDDGVTPRYQCTQLQAHYAGKTCQSIRGDGIDEAVARTFLEAMQPAHLEVSMAALEQIEARARQIDRQWQLRIERAHYEADLARRRFFAVEPENRLVARTLERDWNGKLAEIQRLEREYTVLPKPTARLASPEERERILALAQDLPAVWQAPTTTNAERKQLLRFLIKDVALAKQERTISIGIRWQTEAITELAIPQPKQIWEVRRTDSPVIDRIRELASRHTDAQIAELLNQESLTSGTGDSFAERKVRGLRYAYDISTACPLQPAACHHGQRGDGRYSVEVAAELLKASTSTIARWCRAGLLDGIQAGPGGPWWIQLTSEIIDNPPRQRRSRRSPK